MKIHLQSMNAPNERIVFLLMILNVNAYVNVFLERSLRANEGHIGVNESLLKEIWTQMNVYFL